MKQRRARRRTAYDLVDPDRQPLQVWCDRDTSYRIVDQEGITVVSVMCDRTDHNDNRRGLLIAEAIEEALNAGCRFEVNHRGEVQRRGNDQANEERRA